ncbi:hypothetical protein K2X85_06520 [bacterium]|nr:hypothetical protein [bacterium]
MASLADLELWPHQVQKGKYVRLLQGQVDSLCDENAHGNRELFLDDVFLCYLLAFFNPSLRRLRTIEDFSQTRQVQRHLSIPRLCKSTLTDFHRLVDSDCLRPILAALREAIVQKCASAPKDGDLSQVLKEVVAVRWETFLPCLRRCQVGHLRDKQQPLVLTEGIFLTEDAAGSSETKAGERSNGFLSEAFTTMTSASRLQASLFRWGSK